MKKTWDKAQDIFIKVVSVLTICVMIFTSVSVIFFDKSDRSLLGFRFFAVLSDSMAATDFQAGDLIISKKVKDPAQLAEGDIITFISQNSESFGQVVTHKIRKATYNNNGEPGFVTYGTTTGVDDQTIVTYPYILGKYTGRIPKLGMFVSFQKQPMGYVICILLPFLAIIAYQAMQCLVLFKQYKYETFGYVPGQQMPPQGWQAPQKGTKTQAGPQQTQESMGSQQHEQQAAPNQGGQWQQVPPQGAPGGQYAQYGGPYYGAPYGQAPGYGYVDPEKAELMAQINAHKQQIDRQEKDQMRAEIAELRAMIERQAQTGAGAAPAQPAQPQEAVESMADDSKAADSTNIDKN